MKRIARDELRRRVAEAIELVALSGLETRNPSQLSGGQMQRVALARAIVNRPKVLLLDEPLAALDAKLRRAMQIELKALQKRLGMTFVFVTHDQDEALVLSDRIAVMNAGRIEQIGSPHDVYHRPATAFVASFIGQTNLLDVSVIEPLSCDTRSPPAAREPSPVPRTTHGRDARVTTSRVRTDAGLEFDIASNHPIGTKLLVMIRPERIQIVRDGSPGAFVAQVVERIFRGDTTQLIVRTRVGNQTLQLVQNDTRNETSPGSRQPGEITCRVDPGDVVVVQVGG
jgi:spermidine/putrescine transport system ATP-binding protein